MAALLNTAVCRKKGAVNTLPEVYFSKEKRRLCFIQSRRYLLHLTTKNSLPRNGFFLFAVW